MTLRLADYEAALRPEGDLAEALAVSQRRLRRVQRARTAHGGRAIIVIEGWHASERGNAIRRLATGLDPRHLRAWPIGAPNVEEEGRHWLQRFWAKLPARGEIALFDGSWYRHVLADRVEGPGGKIEWKRACDEINEFEARQVEAGAAIVKLFLHVTAEEQRRRLADRLTQPWSASTVSPEALRQHARYGDYAAATEQMFARTDTRWAPWTVVAAGRAKPARIAILDRVATVLEKGFPAIPPEADPRIVAEARRLGIVRADEGGGAAEGGV
ncbi:polyphosphate kinase 2 family protein [Sphingomonas sp.]|uniref:polyphosphate kinase 2 family protein n=1 Tax=Sphingomonas sp. TaxID=28214 RepID=UPI003B006EFE